MEVTIMPSSDTALTPQHNAQVAKKQKFSAMINTKGYLELINNTLHDPKRANNFIASITSAVVTNPALQECENSSILSGALLGESLGLSPSPQLGQFYLVPFKRKAKYDKSGNLLSPETTLAQFILGYKGYIQLALRTGTYRKLVVLEIKQGELKSWDPLNEVLECTLLDDPEVREKTPTVGYYAMFEYINGFRKMMYWSKAKMLSHADRYSKAFSAEAYQKLIAGEIPQKDMWKYSSFWYADFDEMAKKTMVRQLISRWGVMSAEFISAMENDFTFADFDGKNNVITLSEDEIVLPAPTTSTYEVNPSDVIDSAAPEQISLDSL